jgi:succinate dehydrogenase / fumarate reductase cytochrome b subunit
LIRFYRSTVGKKIIMAVTGLIGIGFVILHIAGNLQAFVGREKINAYSALLHGPGAELLWVVRIVLIVAVILHVLMAVQLTQRARAARPIGYHEREPQISTLASRTMRVGGFLILVFIVLHILHFTVRAFPGYDRTDALGGVDVYHNLVIAFTNPLWVLFYVVAMIFLGLHLYHGFWSSLRTLGAGKPSPHPLKRTAALAVAVIIWAGFTAVPVAIFVGAVRGEAENGPTTVLAPATASPSAAPAALR